MRYVMKQKIFALSDSFTIKNENDMDVYNVRGKIFSIGNKLSFCDMNENEIIYIKQRLMSFKPCYEIYSHGELYGVLKKQLFTFFNCKFDIDTEALGNIEVEGDFIDHEYTFSKNGRTIASVSKKWFSWSDTYGIEISDSEDNAFILACVVAIDMICHDDEHN